MWSPLLATAPIAVMPPSLGCQIWALPCQPLPRAAPSGCMGLSFTWGALHVSSLHPSTTSIYLLLPTSVVSAVNDLTKRGLNGMTNKRYVTAHASAHSKMICNYLISVMQITPSSP